MMSTLSHFHPKIEALAFQLEKLLKVINHSDPSAEQIKHQLYEKYKRNLSLLISELKTSTSWFEVNRYLDSLRATDILTIEEETREIVVNKLIKDFEDAFIVRHQLSELTPPDPVDSYQQRRLKRIRKQIRTNRQRHTSPLKTTDLGDMIMLKNQQKTAKQNLDRLIKAFNKIDLQKAD